MRELPGPLYIGAAKLYATGSGGVMLRRCALAMIVLAGAPARAVEPLPFEGPDRSAVDLIRPRPDHPRIFVQASLPDGSLGLFLVDTGADVSVLQVSTAERLGLELEEGWSRIRGLSGQHTVALATTDVKIGEMTVSDVEFAVGVRGLGENVGFMPLDGILGNNVWSRFVLEIDYPADLLVLHRPGTVKLRRKPDVLFFDGKHVHAPLTVTTGGERPITSSFLAQIDTGADQLTVCAGTGAAFRHVFTEGIEELRGIGASQHLPSFRFLEVTRRIPISRVKMGGRRFSVDTSARWLSFHDLSTDRCDNGLRALVGHEYLADHRVFFDYHGAHFSMTKSRRKPRKLNGHAILLAQDLERYGDDPSRTAYRARMLIGADDLEGARVQLERALASAPDGTEAAEERVLLARLHRHFGDLDRAWQVLSSLPAGALVDQNEIVAAVNGMLFARHDDAAMELALRAVEARPDEGRARVALADVLLSRGDVGAAAEALQEAARLEGFPDAHLLRRARVALAADDRYGAMAHLRKLLQLYPFGGEFLWFYSLLLDDEREAETFRQDMQRAMGRLHPDRRPLDFLVAAHRALGEDHEALSLMRRGMDRHCDALDGPERENCRAWFRAMAGHQLDHALDDIDRALAAEGPRSDFLDTKAMVHLARGELVQAHAAAREAAKLSPEDVYMLWQVERTAALLRSAASAPVSSRLADRVAPVD